MYLPKGVNNQVGDTTNIPDVTSLPRYQMCFQNKMLFVTIIEQEKETHDVTMMSCVRNIRPKYLPGR